MIINNEKDNYSSKTIFIIDNSYEYSTIESNEKIDLQSRPQHRINISSISKSLYTCSIEALFDYSRIVWDLFPNGEKLLIFFSCSPTLTLRLNNHLQQNCEHIFNSFMQSSNFNIENEKKGTENKMFLNDGIRQAFQSLSLPSSDNNNNGGRIILLTFDNDDKNMVTNFRKEILTQFNNRKEFSPNFKLDFIIINSYPLNIDNLIHEDISNESLNERLRFSFLSIASGSSLASSLTFMALKHYNLSSTMICNIPMKEEQNAGSSANYDVEIIHSNEAHNQFFQSQKLLNNDNAIDELYKDVKRDKHTYKSLKLTWVTTSKTTDLTHCIGAYRMTAIDVSSRPSSCLLTFLLSGKTVILENNQSTKSITHLLRCHDGQLFIHVLYPNNNPIVNDAPSITEGVGGRVDDYRINDFVGFMRKNQLKLMKIDDDEYNDDNLGQSCLLLKKQTKYWPISYGLTVFFNMRDQFYQIITKSKLSDNDLIILREIMYHQLQNEKNNIPFPIQSNVLRLRGLKKDDLYRIYWIELELILRCHSHLSPQHQTILQTFLDIKPSNDNLFIQSLLSNNNIENYNHSNQSMITTNNNNHKIINISTINYDLIRNSEENLSNLFSARLTEKRKKLPDFYGRNMKITKLYAGLNMDID